MAFKVLIEVINSVISILNKYKYHLYDFENPKWFLEKIEYQKNEDKIYFKCKEEK